MMDTKQSVAAAEAATLKGTMSFAIKQTIKRHSKHIYSVLASPFKQGGPPSLNFG